ncbi:MAG: HAMP domain-containing histidine kinase [Oscillospiraceae bacterium]|jgi:signal transduction histidine kinase|nr:HAMP domain-containing histidine kinase [Oscillospiraceae bacterium]
MSSIIKNILLATAAATVFNGLLWLALWGWNLRKAARRGAPPQEPQRQNRTAIRAALVILTLELLLVLGVFFMNRPLWVYLLERSASVRILLLSVVIVYVTQVFFFLFVQFQALARRERLRAQAQRDYLLEVAHELKTPMAVVRLLGEEILMDEAHPHERAKKAEQLLEQIDGMNGQIGAVLDASRLEGANYKLKCAEFSLRKAIETLAESYDVLLEERNLHLHLELRSEGEIFGDPARLRQAVANLLANAIQYATPGSEITVTLEETRKRLHLQLRNDCPPIAVKELGKLWRPFKRLEQEGDNAQKGTGLGLSIVHSIVLLHHGRCGAEPVPGGVRFWVTLPKRRRLRRG